MSEQGQQLQLPGGIRGPYVGLAVFCEKVLREGDNVMSLIRIIDRITIQTRVAGGAEMAQTLPTPVFDLFLVVTLKAGDLQGSYTILITQRGPSNQTLVTVNAPVLFEGNDRGVNVVLQLPFQPPEDGLYWFDVSLDGGGLLTRVPLRAIFQTLSMAGPQQ